MATPSPIVKTRLKPALHARFLAELQARKLSESELLRLALCELFKGTNTALTDDGKRPDDMRLVVEPDPAQTHLERKTVWMPAFLMRAAGERAAFKGMSFSRWVSSLVQSNMMRYPVLTEVELLALEAATRELAAIGRYVNQIQRALDAAHFESERIRIDKLVALGAQIDEVREGVRTLIRASRRSWEFE